MRGLSVLYDIRTYVRRCNTNGRTAHVRYARSNLISPPLHICNQKTVAIKILSL